MFETQLTAEFPYPNHSPNTNARQWKYLKQNDPDPWFHIVYIYKNKLLGDGYYLKEAVILSHSLERIFCMVNNEGINIKEIQFMCPASLNRSKNWRMLFITEVYRGFIDGDKRNIGFLLVTDFGDGYLMTPEGYYMDGNLQNETLIYTHS